MKNHRTPKQGAKPILMAAALLSAVVATAPATAKADATLAAVLGGTALAGLVLHANQPLGYPARMVRYHPPPPVYFVPQVRAAHVRMAPHQVRTVAHPAMVYPAGGYYYQPAPVYHRIQY